MISVKAVKDMVNKMCFVCNAKVTDTPGRTFYHYLQYAEEIQEELQLKKVPEHVLQNPGSTFVCNFHFQPKLEHRLIECFVCGAKKSTYPDRQFFPFGARAKYLKLNGVPVNRSRMSTYICDFHFKAKDPDKNIKKINFSDCGIERITKVLKDLQDKKERKAHVRCCVPTCPLVRSQPLINDPSFKCYMFPTSKARADVWTKALKTVPFKSSNVICQRHFDKQCIGVDNRLTMDAIPTLYLGSSTEKCGSEANELKPPSPHSDIIIDLDSDSKSSSDVIEIKDDEEQGDTMETDLAEGEDEYVEADGKEVGDSPPETPFALDSADKVLKYMQPLFDLALLNENYKAVGFLSKLEDIFKKEINY